MIIIIIIILYTFVVHGNRKLTSLRHLLDNNIHGIQELQELIDSNHRKGSQEVKITKEQYYVSRLLSLKIGFEYD